MFCNSLEADVWRSFAMCSTALSIRSKARLEVVA